MRSLWLQATEEYYGKEGELFDSFHDMDNLIAYVGHFHKVPFYVYAYAFADLVVGALYGAYQDNPNGFEQKLMDLLAAGGTTGFKEALAPFGLDPSDPSFWSDALNAHLGSLIDEAEALSKKLGYTT